MARSHKYFKKQQIQTSEIVSQPLDDEKHSSEYCDNQDTVQIFNNNRQRTKSESFVYSNIIRRSSQQFSSIENLESLITCSIHLGLIDEPRQLPCGHAFCYTCLKNYLNHTSQKTNKFIICPLCRYETTIDVQQLESLAASIVHKQLTEYLILKRQKVVNNSLEYSQISPQSDKNVKEIKLELLKHLMKDFKEEISSDSQSNLEKQLNSIFDEHNTFIHRPAQRSRSLSESSYKDPFINVHLKRFDIYQNLDQTSIRKNMRKYREYKLIKSIIHPKQSDIVQVSWMDADESIDCLDDSEVMIYIVKNQPYVFITNFKGTKERHFELKVEDERLNPFFVKCYTHILFVVGSNNCESILIKVSLDGEVLHLSNKYSGNLGGFCVDSTNDSIIVTYPTRHKVLVLKINSLEEIKVFNFGELSPMYVAKSSNCHEIWVSCPEDGRIAVYDEEEDNYLHLDTNQIQDSLPTFINETKDHRILFLDSSWSRIFWIRKWNNHLYIQLLVVFGVNSEMEINYVEPMSENMIMFSNNKKTYIAKPSRSVKEEHRKDKCTLL